MRSTVAALALLFALGGCSTSAPIATTRPAPVASERQDVSWSDYDASVQRRIDDMQALPDCAGLQGEFDTAEANSAATLDRTGHGNSELMSYINEAMELADCF